MARFDEVRVAQADDGSYQIVANNWSGDDGAQTVRVTASDMTDLGKKLGDIFDGKYDKVVDKKKAKDVKDIKGYMKGCKCGKADGKCACESEDE